MSRAKNEGKKAKEEKRERRMNDASLQWRDDDEETLFDCLLCSDCLLSP